MAPEVFSAGALAEPRACGTVSRPRLATGVVPRRALPAHDASAIRSALASTVVRALPRVLIFHDNERPASSSMPTSIRRSSAGTRTAWHRAPPGRVHCRPDRPVRIEIPLRGVIRHAANGREGARSASWLRAGSGDVSALTRLPQFDDRGALRAASLTEAAGRSRQRVQGRSACRPGRRPATSRRGVLCFTRAELPLLHTLRIRAHLLPYRKALAPRITRTVRSPRTSSSRSLACSPQASIPPDQQPSSSKTS